MEFKRFFPYTTPSPLDLITERMNLAMGQAADDQQLVKTLVVFLLASTDIRRLLDRIVT